MGNIPFTQCLKPNGCTRNVYVPRPDDIYKKARDIIDAGYCFEIEILRTGEVYMTISNGEEDKANEVADNNPAVIDVVDRMITRFHKQIKGGLM